MEKLTEILNEREDVEGGTEWKSVYGMTTEERNRLFNMKQEKEAEDGTDENSVDEMTFEEKDRLRNLKNEVDEDEDEEEEEEEDEEVVESEERQIVKLEWEEGVGDDLGFGIKQEVMDEEEDTGGTDLNFPTYRCERRGVESEYCQKEGLSSLVTECLLKQPKVSINRLNITGVSVGVSPERCSVACEEDDLGLRSQWRLGKLSPMLGNCPQRQMGEITTWKREMFGQLNRTGIQLPSSLDNGIFIDASSNHLDSHKSQDTAETVEAASPLFHCSHCPFFHTEEVSLQQHFEKVHLEELAGPVVSGVSGVEKPTDEVAHLQSSKSFQTSTESHKGTSATHKCALCGKCFKCKSQLAQHHRTHTGERPYRCTLCGLSFCTSGNLLAHQRTHTGERRYHCSQCGNSFMRLAHLIRHQGIHTGERPYHCSLCGKNFRQLHGLDVHVRTHTGERPYRCSQCGKSYKSKSGLTVHLRTHTGERPYHCSQCGKNFGHLSCLQLHKRTHTGERPYPCSQCGKNFRDLHGLKRHQRTHTGERPYSCSLCGKKFTQFSVLQKHQKFHAK